MAQEDTESYSPSVAPTIVICNNTPGWIYPVTFTDKVVGLDDYTCDDPQVVCSDVGSIGDFSFTYDKPASQHCCKCKEACTAAALCLEPASTFSPTSSDGADDGKMVSATIAVTIIIVVVIGFLCVKANREALENERDLSSTRHTMSERRREQATGRTEAEVPPANNAARRQEILSQFCCQSVLPDRSNASLSSLRFSTVQDAAEASEAPTPVEPPAARPSQVSSREKRKSTRLSSASLSNMLASWRRPSQKDECCICLDGYHPGETICASKTNKCNHIFHQECVVEWLMRNHDCCPLCRVNLME
eukprot:scaffold23790_cov166-Cylindrotheca_fusiformis.AAC.2